MTRGELLDTITELGSMYDGHVTNGSARALADLFELLLEDQEKKT